MSTMLDGVALSNAYADNRATISDLRNQSSVILWVDYTKDTDDGLKILVEYGVTGDDGISATDFFTHSQIDTSTGLLTDMEYTMTASGKRALPILKPRHADVVRVSAKTTTPGGSPGTVTINETKDNEHHIIA